MDDLDDMDPTVGFLYKAMLQRDPQKRRVKPVQRHLLQLNFGGFDDSSEDSDFEVASDKGSGDSLDSGASSHHSESDSEEDSDDEDTKEQAEETDYSVGQLLEQAKAVGMEIQKAPSEETGTSTSSSKRLKVLICCVCLGDSSEEDDEIVECDGCGVLVHEGCYGIAESQSVASTVSSASTEPWFCDACKAGVTPHCELCPELGGIYKETDTGRWVHIVCALYVPGVAFGDIDKLSPVTLFEMPYSRWGVKDCSLCEDERFSRTGVCIGCDAGMCRTYFHVTCAQREGLLSEASPEEDIADPFYAYCKQHADKCAVRIKRRNWLAIQSHMKQHGQDQEAGDDKEKIRVRRKLNRHRRKYLEFQNRKPPSWVPTQRVSRMLTTSSMAVRRLLKKAEMLGINTQAQHTQSHKNIRKRWHVAPALTVEFVSYYHDRGVRMKNMRVHLRELLAQREKLQGQERVLRVKYDQFLAEVGDLRESATKLQKTGEQMWKILSDLAGKTLPVPEVVRPKKPGKSPLRKETPRSPGCIIFQCGICYKTHDQHLLAKCDTCKEHYHLGCLDPPLTRMPKKSKYGTWQCSLCSGSTPDDSEIDEIDPHAPRRLREKIKEPVKFTPLLKEAKRKNFKMKRGRKPVSKKMLKLGRKKPDKDSLPGKARKPSLRKPRRMVISHKSRDIRTECAICMKPGSNSSLVRCDDCQLCYHLGCLSPPMKKTPKQRGYIWYCTACGEQPDSDTMDIEDQIQYGANSSSPAITPPEKTPRRKQICPARYRQGKLQDSSKDDP